MTAGPTRDPSEADRIGVGAGLLAMMFWSTGVVLAKGIDLPGLAVISYRMVMYVGLVLAWAWWRGSPLTARGLRISLVGGVMFGLDLAFYYTALKATTIANATIIGSCQPVIALIVGPIFFKERPRRSHFLYASIAIGGAVLVVLGSAGLSGWSLKGDLAAFGALVFFSGYFTASKAAAGKVSSTEFTAGTAVWATAVVLPIALVARVDFGPPGTNSWIALVALALGPGMIGHLLMNYSIAEVPLWLGSTLTLFIPVGSTIMASVFLDEQVRSAQYIGMAVVIAALAAIVIRPNLSTVPQLDPAG